MTVPLYHSSLPLNPRKRQRRTATTLLAGDFDPRPPRDVLTSLLNGVGPYKLVEKDEESRRTKKRDRRERDRDRRQTKSTVKTREKTIPDHVSDATPTTSTPLHKSDSYIAQQSGSSTSSFWRARPAIHIATMHRYVSVTPPPMPSPPPPMVSSPSTPGPSTSSGTSRTSSKRPRTPDDYEDILRRQQDVQQPPPPPPQRKKRFAVKKGWKGWVEGSPPPSEKLINLDAVPVLQERRTRSGKSFDAIGVGKDGWV